MKKLRVILVRQYNVINLPVVHIKVKCAILMCYLISQKVLKLWNENFFILRAHAAKLLEQLAINVIIYIHHDAMVVLLLYEEDCVMRTPKTLQNKTSSRISKHHPEVAVTSHWPEVRIRSFYTNLIKIITMNYLVKNSTKINVIYLL